MGLPYVVTPQGKLGVVSVSMAGDTKIILLSISCKAFLSGYGFRVALVTPRVPLGGQLAPRLCFLGGGGLRQLIELVALFACPWPLCSRCLFSKLLSQCLSALIFKKSLGASSWPK